MTLEDMQNKVQKYAAECEKNYIGGEIYFNELDRLIKFDTELLSGFVLYAIQTEKIRKIACTGEIGNLILKCKDNDLLPNDLEIVVFNGGLRNDNKVVKLINAKTNGNYIFVDDSLYSGKTLRAIKKYLNRHGAEIQNCYVFYDGSLKKYSNVHSLFRYY